MANEKTQPMQNLQRVNIELNLAYEATVVDVWDALISDRPFRKAWPDDQASNYMREQAGSRFDPQMVEAFLNAEIKKKVTKALI